MKRPTLHIGLLIAGSLAVSCSKDPEPSPQPDLGDDVGLDAAADMTSSSGGDVGVDAATAPDVGDDLGPDWELEPVPEPPDETATDASRAAGFKLYYRERLDRMLLAANRFHFMGDVGWATNTRGAKIARSGDDYEVVVGPSDNNRIGNTVWNVYNAYRVFQTRELELTLIRLLNGLVFFEQVTGHPGMTSRAAYPGWTRTVDGNNQTVERSRFGSPITVPGALGQGIEDEVISTFFTGTTFTYRENPEDFMFSLFPALEPGEYSMTHSFIELPKLIRSGECCSSLMRTPDDETWAGAYWNNHNSRDNFPDLGLGYLAAKLAAADGSLSQELRDAASAAAEAGERIGQLVLDSDTAIITVSNIGTYDTFEVSGTIRPHGEPENQDLGSIGACPMAFMAQAMTSEGLVANKTIPLPGSTDKEFFSTPALQNNLNCDIPDEPVCVNLDDGYCGRPWGAFQDMVLQGKPILQYFEDNPGLAQALLGSWQNDFDDVTEAAMVVYHHAKATGDDVMLAQARRAIHDLTTLQMDLADHAFGDDVERRARQRRRAALYRAECDLPVEGDELVDLTQYDDEAFFMENGLNVGDTPDAPLLTDSDIEAAVEDELSRSTLPHVVERYRNTYPDGPPVRRKGNGYEAKGSPEADLPWRDVERPRHVRIGSPAFLDAMPLCEQAPQWLSCEWAVLGCERPDLNADRVVDASDTTAYEAAEATFAGQTCAEANSWCEGADLDRDGAIDASDRAFLDAATGCWY